MNEAKQSIDLASITTLKSAEVEIVHPATAVGLGVMFLLAGPEHEVRKRAGVEAARRMRDRILADDLDVVTTDAQETEVLVASTLGWRRKDDGGPVTFGGEPLPFSAEAARKLYTDPERHWLRMQVRNALERRAVFIGGSPAA